MSCVYIYIYTRNMADCYLGLLKTTMPSCHNCATNSVNTCFEALPGTQ